MRQQYKCICDHCKKEIEKVNDENELKLNEATYQLCPSCFEVVCNLLYTLRR